MTTNPPREPPGAAPIEPREFRNALGHFATGVTVITAQSRTGELVGVTANSFNSVSLDPPMVLWSLSKTSRGLPFFLDTEYFCVNVLAADQVSVSNHFAGKKERKFTDIDYEQGVGGAPLLRECAARFQCRTAFTYEGGDHLIFVGEVIAFDHTGKAGLVYHQGKYAVSDIHAYHAEENPMRGGGFVDDYLDYLLTAATDRFQRRFQQVLDRTGRHEFEWRVLAVLSDRPGISFELIMRQTLIDARRLRELLKEMEGADLVSSQAWGLRGRIFPDGPRPGGRLESACRREIARSRRPWAMHRRGGSNIEIRAKKNHRLLRCAAHLVMEAKETDA